MKSPVRLLLAAATLVAASSAHAAAGSWNVDADGNWSLGTNWAGTIADGETSVATFGNDITANRTVTLDSSRTIGGLTFDDVGASADSNWILNSSGGSILTLDNTAGAGTGTATINVTNTATINAVLSGGGLTKTGAGTLVLGAANTFTGTTTNSAGTLNLSNSLALQNSTLNTAGIVFDSSVASKAFTFGGLSGGNISLQNNAAAAIALTVGGNNASTTYGGALSGSGSLIKVGTGTLTLNTTGTYSGGTIINGGTILLGGVPNGIGSGAVTVNNGGKLDIQGWGISNSFKLAGGTLTQTGYSGGSLNNGVTLLSGTASTISSVAASVLTLNGITHNVGATVNFSSGTEIRTSTGTASTILTDTTTGAAYATFGGTDWAAKTTGTGNTAVVGLSSIAGGYTAFATTGSVGLSGNANLTSAVAGTYTLNGNSTTTTVRNITAANNIDLGGNTLTTGGILSNQTAAISGAGSLQAAVTGGELVFHQTTGTTTISAIIANNTSASRLTKAGAGTLTLNGANTYTGVTAIAAGTVNVGASGSINVNGANGITVASGATLALAGTLEVTSLFDSINISSGGTFTAGGTLDLNGVFDGYTGDYSLISTTGTKSGNFTLTGYNGSNALSYNGSTGVLSFTAVPEPSTYGLLGAGALAAAAFVRRRRKAVGVAA
jgi:fibronectin-binding autotransporter adhesin